MQHRVRRPLLVFLLGALCALFLSLFLSPPLLFAGFLLFLLIGAVFFAFYEGGFVPAVTSLLSLGIAFGFLWHAAYDTSRVIPAQSLDGCDATLIVTVETLEEFGFVARGSDGTHSFPIYVRYYNDGSILPGDRFSMTAHFAKPSFRAGFDAPRNYASRGIHILATPESLSYLSHSETLHTLLHRIQTGLRSQIDRLFPTHSGEMAALLIGQRRDFPESTRQDLVATGLSHAFVVSGMHLSFVAAFFLLFSRMSPRLSLLLMPITLAYAAVTGFGHSVIRAFWMLAYRTIGGFLNRRPDPSISFFLSLFCILCQNPYALWSMGLIYSYLAVAGILYLGPRLRTVMQYPLLLLPGDSPLRWGMQRLIAVVSTSLSAGIATLPASAVFTGCISLLFPLTNLLFLWLITLIFYLGLPALLLSFLSYPLAQILAAAVSFLLELLLEAVAFMAQLPSSLLGLNSRWPIAALFLCLLLLFFCAAVKKRILHPLPLALCIVFLLSGAALGQYEKVSVSYSLTCPSTKEPCLLLTVGTTHVLLGYDEQITDLCRKNNIQSPDLIILPDPLDIYLLPEGFASSRILADCRSDVSLGKLTLHVFPNGNTHIETPDGTFSVLFDRGAVHPNACLTLLSRKAIQDDKTRFLLLDDTRPLLLLGEPPRIPKWDYAPDYLPYSDGTVIFTNHTLPIHER